MASAKNTHRRRWAYPSPRIKSSAMFITFKLCVTLSAAFRPHFPVMSRRTAIYTAHVKCHSAPKKRTHSYNLHTITTEEEVIREQSLRSNEKSLQSNAKKGQRGIRNTRRKQTLPTEPTANNKPSNGKKGRQGLSAQMPPWLSQYENDDLVASYHLSEESNTAASLSSIYDADNRQSAFSSMQTLKLALNGIFHYPASVPTGSNSDLAVIPYFTSSEINDILDSVRVASHGNSNLMSGCADFLYLMLTLEEEGVLTSDFLSSESWNNNNVETTDDDGCENDATTDRPGPFSIMTRDVLIAAAFHYCDCVRARKAGVYDYARQAMEASLDMRTWKEPERKKQLWLPPASTIQNMEHVWGSPEDQGIVRMNIDGKKIKPANEAGKSIVLSTMRRVTSRKKTPIEQYGEESFEIHASAARLKRVEIMSSIVNSNGGQSPGSGTDLNHPNGNAEILRSFLVSLSEDWRALVVRSVACLYRLRGIVEDPGCTQNSVNGDTGKSTGSVVLSSTKINSAREAFFIYAPLAQRLGMHRLKAELENTAFRLLYPRQFSMASSLFICDISEMKSLIRALSSRIEQLLRSDPVLHDQLEDVTVNSRIKEPYSLWRKILRQRKKIGDTKNKPSRSIVGTGKEFQMLLKWVPDVIALRVVLRARRLSSWEDDESLRTREKMSCYFALQLIGDVWPASIHNQAKDYIKNPKPNGYQSLHYTARLMISGEEWPFEVQIRSEEMHRVAEFGVAAHWDYKLQNKAIKPVDRSISQGDTLLALPPAGNATQILTEMQSLTIGDNLNKMPESPSRTRESRIAPYIEALTSSREKIMQNNMFVFLSSTKSASDGKIVSIDPSYSCTDILDKYGPSIDEDILSDVADGTLQIYQNGVSTSLDKQLSNGDVLTLPSAIIEKLSV